MPTPIWPERPSLKDAFDKLDRAKEHLKTLRREIEPVEQRDTHTIGFEVDADAGKYTFYVRDLEPLPDNDWGLVIGDCLHNARTALDYLMVRLVALVTQQSPRDIDSVRFPIYDSPKQFAGAVGELRKHPAFSGYLARIEELQPHNLGNPSVWGTRQLLLPWLSPGETKLQQVPVMHSLPTALNRLSLLDNLDKHRVIHAAWLAVELNFMDDQLEPTLRPPPGFELKGGTIACLGPLEDGAEVGSMEFRTPLPCDWEPEQVDMKRQFSLRVSLYDERPFAAGVLEVLPSCLWGVEAVLSLFEPVFSDLQPPLPVTAISDPG